MSMSVWPRTARSPGYDAYIPHCLRAFAPWGPIRRRKRDYKENRSSTGLLDGLIGFGSDARNWMAFQMTVRHPGREAFVRALRGARAWGSIR